MALGRHCAGVFSENRHERLYFPVRRTDVSAARRPLQQLAQQLGTDTAQTQQAVGAALPLLLGAMGNNSAQPQGAQALFGALQDHGSGNGLESILGSLLGGGNPGRNRTAAPSSATSSAPASSAPKPGWAKPPAWAAAMPPIC